MASRREAHCACEQRRAPEFFTLHVIHFKGGAEYAQTCSPFDIMLPPLPAYFIPFFSAATWRQNIS
jgi:hypothetical protein